MLRQRDDNGAEHPVAFYSRKLLPREVRYSTIEKECLAIKAATHIFRVYLLGRKFTIQTDHHALEWLNRLKDNNAHLTRWSLALQPYQFVVQYRAGAMLTGSLSRANVFFTDECSVQLETHRRRVMHVYVHIISLSQTKTPSKGTCLGWDKCAGSNHF